MFTTARAPKQTVAAAAVVPAVPESPLLIVVGDESRVIVMMRNGLTGCGEPDREVVSVCSNLV